MLYRWQDQLEANDDRDGPFENIKERDPRIQLTTAKRLLADKTLEVEFLKGALQKSRGSTPEQHATWRNGIYDQIRELMTMHGKLGL